MIRYIRSNQTEKLPESKRNLNVEDVWLKHFDGTEKSVVRICKILGIRKMEIVEAYISDSVTSIGRWAFEACNSLANITIPDSVKVIGAYAFHGCVSLKHITIPDSVTEIGEAAFMSCNSLESIILPYGIKEIRQETFSECTSLTSIVIPNSVTEIDEDVFRGCNSLTVITGNPYAIEYCQENNIFHIDET